MDQPWKTRASLLQFGSTPSWSPGWQVGRLASWLAPSYAPIKKSAKPPASWLWGEVESREQPDNPATWPGEEGPSPVTPSRVVLYSVPGGSSDA